MVATYHQEGTSVYVPLITAMTVLGEGSVVMTTTEPDLAD